MGEINIRTHTGSVLGVPLSLQWWWGLDCRMRGLLLRWGGLRPRVWWTAKRQALLPRRCSMQRQQQTCANKGDRVGPALFGGYCRPESLTVRMAGSSQELCTERWLARCLALGVALPAVRPPGSAAARPVFPTSEALELLMPCGRVARLLDS